MPSALPFFQNDGIAEQWILGYALLLLHHLYKSVFFNCASCSETPPPGYTSEADESASSIFGPGQYGGLENVCRTAPCSLYLLC